MNAGDKNTDAAKRKGCYPAFLVQTSHRNVFSEEMIHSEKPACQIDEYRRDEEASDVLRTQFRSAHTDGHCKHGEFSGIHSARLTQSTKHFA